MNRLARERSPYLLQHAGNPVDWYPWGDEAFERARQEDKPIFLSIGYSTCHWCHVMEHESFEDQAIAERLNRDFVSIKVDREERPDVDRVYMSFVQATTGQGGWPMTVFLTPELKPFFGGTYFPPTSRFGRPGFADLLGELSRVWTGDRRQVESAAGELLQRLRAVTGTDGRATAESRIAQPDALDAAVEQYRRVYDRDRGGFGDAPKFPRPSELLFLLREHARRAAAALPRMDTGPRIDADPVAPRMDTDSHGSVVPVDAAGSQTPGPLAMVTGTLRAMALGGMRDHIGGGFHRYSVDGDWRVPHFEKMLYDQAQLVLACLEAAQASGDGFLAEVAEDTLAYVMRDMTHADGGFYSAEDADSAPPEEPGGRKTEGAFYIWTDEEIGALLGDDAEVARRRYGIRPGGNAPSDPHGEFTGRNLLYTAASIEDVASHSGRSGDQVRAALERVRQRLLTARASRPRPHLDDKILTAWNGLMIAACARAARVLPDSPFAVHYLAAAQRAAGFIRTVLWRADTGTLLRRYRDGEAAIGGFAEDYAFLGWGVLELFQADGDPEWLEWALVLQQRLDEQFGDAADGGWFSTTGQDPTVLLRLKEEYDGAEPAAGSVATLNALTIGHLTGDRSALARAERTLARYGPRIGAAARVVPMMLCALSSWYAGFTQVVIAGDRAAPGTRALAAEAARHYDPFALHIPLASGVQQQRLGDMLPFVTSMSAGGGAAAYVCREFTCRQPVSTPDALRQELQGHRAGR